MLFSNDKLNVLYNRLIKAYPEYEAKYKAEMTNVKSLTETTDMQVPKFKFGGLQEILERVQEVEQDDSSSLAAIDSLKFSSNELDDVFDEIKAKLSINSIQANVEKTNDIVLMPTKKISLSVERIKNHMRKVSIAIDGPSGSGKSTVAKELADKYGLKYINTGLVYRAIAINALHEGANLEKSDEVISTLRHGMIELLADEVVMLHGVNVTKEVRSDEASQGASKVAAIPEVRE